MYEWVRTCELLDYLDNSKHKFLILFTYSILVSLYNLQHIFGLLDQHINLQGIVKHKCLCYFERRDHLGI